MGARSRTGGVTAKSRTKNAKRIMAVTLGVALGTTACSGGATSPDQGVGEGDLSSAKAYACASDATILKGPTSVKATFELTMTTSGKADPENGGVGQGERIENAQALECQRN
jgi:hypothetical protein